MLNKISFCLIITSVLLAACSDRQPAKHPEDTKAQAIVDRAIEAHGGDSYRTAAVEFDFRDRHYSLRRYPDHYLYTRSFTDSSGQVTDVLRNSTSLIRLVNGDTADLSDEWRTKYANSVNSVLYFAQLPFGLNDPAVNKRYLGEVTIKGQPYDKIEVTFDQQGGGKDFEDIFVYWFNKKTAMLDYFGYYYNTDETGIRFREAYYRQKVAGITFQDYVNYEPIDSAVTVYQTDSLFEHGRLQELSRIENGNLQPLRQ